MCSVCVCANLKDAERQWLSWSHLVSVMDEYDEVALDVHEPVLSEDGQASPVREAIQRVLGVSSL